MTTVLISFLFFLLSFFSNLCFLRERSDNLGLKRDKGPRVDLICESPAPVRWTPSLDVWSRGGGGAGGQTPDLWPHPITLPGTTCRKVLNLVLTEIVSALCWLTGFIMRDQRQLCNAGGAQSCFAECNKITTELSFMLVEGQILFTAPRGKIVIYSIWIMKHNLCKILDEWRNKTMVYATGYVYLSPLLLLKEDKHCVGKFIIDLILLPL